MAMTVRCERSRGPRCTRGMCHEPLGHVGCRLRAQMGTTQKETNLIVTQIKQVRNGNEIRDNPLFYITDKLS